MATTRMTSPMRTSLESRLSDLDARIEALEVQRQGDDSMEATAMLMQLSRERADIADALADSTLIDDEPFDMQAIEIGDLVTIQGPNGHVERYVLIDDGVGTRARSDWVSVGSPLGSAIVGRSQGDEVEVESPGGTVSYVILAFERASEENSVRVVSFGSIPSRGAALLPSEAFLG